MKVYSLLLIQNSEGDSRRGNYDEPESFNFGENEDTLSLDTLTILEMEGIVSTQLIPRHWTPGRMVVLC